MVVKESIARDILRLIVWYPVRWLVSALPVRLSIALLGMMGSVHFMFSKGGKALLEENLKRLDVGDASKERVVRDYFRNHCVDRLLIFIFPMFGASHAKSLISFSGLDNLDKALQEGRGVVLVHGHFGPVHLPLVALSRLGYRMKQIGLPSDEGLSWIGKNVAFRLRLKYESMMPAEIIKADGFLRGAFRWLGENGVVMITGDGSGTSQTVGRHAPFTFCGEPVMFPLGPALLARKTGAKILPMFITPGDGKFLYNVIIEEPFNLSPGDEDFALETTRRFAGRLEAYVKRYPSYMHFLDRFSTEGIIVKKNRPS